jgi:hypothetical protein
MYYDGMACSKQAEQQGSTAARQHGDHLAYAKRAR